MSTTKNRQELIDVDEAAELLITGARTAKTHILFAHGAGAPMTAPWMTKMAEALEQNGFCVHRFEFAYMAARRQGRRAPPPKAERLIPEFLRVVQAVHRGLGKGQRLLIGGKSMGGRVASMAVDELYGEGLVKGLVSVSYPFHPPKKPSSLRVQHLTTLRAPALIVQGERDPLGNRDDVTGLVLSPTIAVHWIEDGDHDLKGRVSKVSSAYNPFVVAARAIAQFATSL